LSIVYGGRIIKNSIKEVIGGLLTDPRAISADWNFVR